MKRNIAPLLFGIAFVLAGLGYLGSAVWGWDFSIFFRGWWTLFIIVPCLVSLFVNGPHGFNIGGTVVGVLLLLNRQYILTNRQTWVLIVATAVICVGLGLILHYVRGPKKYDETQSASYSYNPPSGGYTYTAPSPSEPGGGDPAGTVPPPSGASPFPGDQTPFPSYNAILSGVNVRNTSSDFAGGRISAVLGGADIDLRDAVVTHDITVYATAVLGGVDVLAPRNVRIHLNKTDILGGTQCTAYTMPPESGAPIVTFCCNCVLGGIEIK